jgi:hypothetical protein
MMTFKLIKPQRLRDNKMRLTLLNAVRKAARDIQKDFEKTTETWEHKVKFESLVSLTGPGPVVLVGTDDEIYTYVDKGTRPHEIWAGAYTGKSDKTSLAFRTGHTPKTQPRVIGSGPGGTSGDLVYPIMVNHPGTEAREFDVTIAAKWDGAFKRRMEDAMVDAGKESGHAI